MKERPLTKAVIVCRDTPRPVGTSGWSGYRDLEGKGPTERPSVEEQSPSISESSRHNPVGREPAGAVL